MDYNIEWRDVARAQCLVLQSQKAVTAYLESKQLLPFGFAQHSCSDVRWLAKEEGYCWCGVTTYTATQHPPAAAAAAAGSAASQTRAGFAVVEGGFSHTTPNDVLPDHSHRILYHLGQYLSADNVVELHWSRLSTCYTACHTVTWHEAVACQAVTCHLTVVCQAVTCHEAVVGQAVTCHEAVVCQAITCQEAVACQAVTCHLAVACHQSQKVSLVFSLIKTAITVILNTSIMLLWYARTTAIIELKSRDKLPAGWLKIGLHSNTLDQDYIHPTLGQILVFAERWYEYYKVKHIHSFVISIVLGESRATNLDSLAPAPQCVPHGLALIGIDSVFLQGSTTTGIRRGMSVAENACLLFLLYL